LLDSVSGGIKVGLVGEPYFRPGRGGNARGDGGVGVSRVVESKFEPVGEDINRGGSRGNRDLEDVFVELCNEVGG